MTVELASESAPADVTVTAAPTNNNDTPQFPASFWVPVVQLPSRASELTMAQLGDAVAGRLTDWSSVTGESMPLRVMVAADAAPPFAQWWPDATPAVEALPLDQLTAALSDDPGALAIVPLDAVNASMRSLAVDGVNIVFGSGDIASYPLTERRWVTTRAVDKGKFSDVLHGLAKELAKNLMAASPDPIIMRVTGDIIPSRCAYAKQRDYGDYKHAFLQLGPWLSQADVTVGSVDASLADVSPPFGCIDTFNLAAPAASIEGLVYSGFDVITNAANHAMDCGQVGACGPEAMFATKANLLARGIETVGTGTDLRAARKPAVLTVKGVRFAFLGYDDIQTLYHAEPGVAGTAPLDEGYVREDVAAAAAQADVVIVMPHWGIEYQAEPTDRQRTLARAAVESGADLVLGNHAHWVAAEEMIDGAFVEYALGNFVFDQDWSLPTQQGVVLDAAFHGKQLKGVRYYPVHIFDQNQPRLAEPAEAQQILDRIWNASATLR
jgi:poly-gamma-glutamate synthesis protein (capsule biosynthesis protein)